MYVDVDVAVELYHSRTVLGVVEEVELVAALLQTGYQLAMEGVFGRGFYVVHRNHLADSQTVMVVPDCKTKNRQDSHFIMNESLGDSIQDASYSKNAYNL